MSPGSVPDGVSTVVVVAGDPLWHQLLVSFAGTAGALLVALLVYRRTRRDDDTRFRQELAEARKERHAGVKRQAVSDLLAGIEEIAALAMDDPSAQWVERYYGALRRFIPMVIPRLDYLDSGQMSDSVENFLDMAGAELAESYTEALNRMASGTWNQEFRDDLSLRALGIYKQAIKVMTVLSNGIQAKAHDDETPGRSQ